ncbi:MAG: HYR-like domain-containing protein, partial [Limisphaerales bacterium]
QGQLGDGTFRTSSPYGSSIPVQVIGLPGGRKSVAIAGGGDHSLALADDGTMWAWGNGYQGQLGDGTFRTSSPFGSSIPVPVIGLPSSKRVLSIGTGWAHSFALLGDANQPPVAKCKNVTVSAGVNCTANALIDDGSFDPDAGDTITLSQSPAGPYSLGDTTVTLTATDSHGASSSCQATVTVVDTTPPMPNLVTLPTVTGQCSATIAAPTATDNCAGIVTGTTSDPLTYSSQGTFTVHWTYSDGHGNSSSQTQTVVVKDTMAPVPDVATLPIVSGQCSATIAAPPTATDECAGKITGTTTDAVSYTAQGSYTVTWHYNDGNGNESTQTQTVIVKDMTAPVPDVASLPAITGQCSATIAAPPTATDNCAGNVVGTTTDPLTYTAQGTYTLTWHYNDGNGHVSSQRQTVVVKDTMAPVPDLTTLPIVTGQCSATIAAPPTATDNCAGKIVGTTTDPLIYTAQGTYRVIWHFNDGNGNGSMQTQTVIVKDTIPPVPDVAALPDVTGQCSATIANVPTATDNCAGKVTGTTTDPLTYTAQGTYTVTWSYADGHGNQATQTQRVIVHDTTAPQIACPADLSLPCSVDLLVPVTFAVTATDNCDPAPVVVASPSSGSLFPVGITTVNCTATDASGNQSVCSFTVTRAPLDFTGFLSPMGGADASGGSYASPLRTFKLGSTIPVKFTASCDGAAVLSRIHRLQVIHYTSATTAGNPIDARPEDAATTGDQFRLVDGQWMFNLDTKGTGMSTGVWLIRATLSDGSQHSVWVQLK